VLHCVIVAAGCSVLQCVLLHGFVFNSRINSGSIAECAKFGTSQLAECAKLGTSQLAECANLGTLQLAECAKLGTSHQ